MATEKLENDESENEKVIFVKTIRLKIAREIMSHKIKMRKLRTTIEMTWREIVLKLMK